MQNPPNINNYWILPWSWKKDKPNRVYTCPWIPLVQLSDFFWALKVKALNIMLEIELPSPLNLAYQLSTWCVKQRQKMGEKSKDDKFGSQLCHTVTRRVKTGVADALWSLWILGMGGSVWPRELEGKAIFKGSCRCLEQLLPFPGLGTNYRLTFYLQPWTDYSQFNYITYENQQLLLRCLGWCWGHEGLWQIMAESPILLFRVNDPVF